MGRVTGMKWDSGNERMNVLVTGVNGFIGAAVFNELLLSRRFLCIGAARGGEEGKRGVVVPVGQVSENTDWTQAVGGASTIIHALGLAHGSYTHAELHSTNVRATLSLARQAANLGVKRFIFISSVNAGFKGSALDATGGVKLEAEQGLQLMAKKTGMEVVIIRPPLVYGPGVKANFLNLMKLAKTGFPLPFAAVNNKRSMIYIGNLVDFVVKCVKHPAAANKVFLISDGRDLSLSELLTQLRLVMGKSARLISVPVFLFRLAGKALSKQGLIERLVGDLQVDSSKANDLLAWTPPYSVEQGIQATVADFLEDNK